MTEPTRDRVSDARIAKIAANEGITGEFELIARELIVARAEIERLKAIRWKCQSCGCEFPKIPYDDDVELCSSCMALKVLLARLKAREKYVQHLPECETEMKPVWLTADGPPQCTCGLAETERGATC